MDGLSLLQGLSYHLSISTRHGLLSFVMNIWCDTLFIYEFGVFAHITFHSSNKYAHIYEKLGNLVWCGVVLLMWLDSVLLEVELI